MAVWEDYLLPFLMRKDAARLGSTCKALRDVVREHVMNIGIVHITKLQAALTTFPRARTAVPYCYHLWDWEPPQSRALVEWLCLGGRGRSITKFDRMTSQGAVIRDFIHAALRGGAFPSLKCSYVNLADGTHRASLIGGLLRAMHELRLRIADTDDWELQFAALGLVRQLPALVKLAFEPCTQGDVDRPLQWPRFIPPSLKALCIDVQDCDIPTGRSLLRALPGVLGASGARLDRLEVKIHTSLKYLGNGLIHVAQALRCCSSTLKVFLTWTDDNLILIDQDAEDRAEQVERLRVQWADVLAGLSTCRELQYLLLPYVEVEPLFPPNTTFGRLTNLEISPHQREQPPDAGAMGLWELMASGGLPALIKLKVTLEGACREREVRTWVAPAFEAVAGTLTHLRLEKWSDEGYWPSDEVDVAYELGVAVGKLRRLQNLTLDMSEDGRAYHAFSQGLTASGGDCPVPYLWRVGVTREIEAHAHMLASLLRPSVRVFGSSYLGSQEPLLTACALRQAGYRHVWAVHSLDKVMDAVRGIVQCMIGEDSVGNGFWSVYPPE
jgi:hypothetical protein